MSPSSNSKISWLLKITSTAIPFYLVKSYWVLVFKEFTCSGSWRSIKYEPNEAATRQGCYLVNCGHDCEFYIGSGAVRDPGIVVFYGYFLSF